MPTHLRPFCLAIFICFAIESCSAEFGSAQNMAAECRIALDVAANRIEHSAANNLLTGECIGYIQAGVDASLAMSENVDWYKICIPDDASTQGMMRKFVAFVDKYPQYNLAYTSLFLMLQDEYPCKQQKTPTPPTRK